MENKCTLKKIADPGNHGLLRAVWEVLIGPKLAGHIEIDFSEHEPWRPLIVRAIHADGTHHLCMGLFEARETFKKSIQ